MMDIKIRDAVRTDIEQLTCIYNWAVENTTASFDIEPQTVEKRLEWFGHYGGAHPLIIAEIDGTLAGYSSLSKFREKEGYAKTVEISVYIHPEFHGKGIGTVLMEEVIKRGRKLGYHVIIAGITEGNDVSIKLHEKFGFKLSAHLHEVGFKFGKWQDCLFYELIL